MAHTPESISMVPLHPLSSPQASQPLPPTVTSVTISNANPAVSPGTYNNSSNAAQPPSNGILLSAQQGPCIPSATAPNVQSLSGWSNFNTMTRKTLAVIGLAATILTIWWTYSSLQEAKKANRLAELAYIGTFRDDCRAEGEARGNMSAACTETLRKPLPQPTWVDNLLDKRSAVLLEPDLTPGIIYHIRLSLVSTEASTMIVLTAVVSLLLDGWAPSNTGRLWFSVWLFMETVMITLSVAVLYLVVDDWDRSDTGRTWHRALIPMDYFMITVSAEFFSLEYSERSATRRLSIIARVFIVLPIITLSIAVIFLAFEHCEPDTTGLRFEALVFTEIHIIMTLSTAVFLLAQYRWKQLVTRRIRAIKTLCTDQPKRGRMVSR